MKKNTLIKDKICLLALLVSLISLGQECTVIYNVDFNNHGNVDYSLNRVIEDFGKIKPYTGAKYRGLPRGSVTTQFWERTAQTTTIENNTLRAEYKANDAGGKAGGFLFDPYFTGVEEAYLEYRVKFDDDFFWASGGKLPGLGGSTVGTTSESVGRGSIPSGGNYNESGTGFSARFMWRRNRNQTDVPNFILYSYFAKRQDGSNRRDGNYGDGYKIYSGDRVNGEFAGLQANTWYKIKQYIKLNTPGRNDGIVKVWINDNLEFNNSTMNIRKTGKSDLKINALVMNTYRGGSRTDTIWHSPRTEYAFFDDFKVWTGCEEFPDDSSTNTAPEVSITKPNNNETFILGETIDLAATATDVDNNIEKINFKIDDAYYRTSAQSTHNTTFTPQNVGTYKIAAKAFDTDGLSEEKFVTIRVVEPAPVNQAPVVTVTAPENGSVFELGQTINLSSTATDADDNLEKINFKINNTYYRTSTTTPFNTTYTPNAVGTYKIAAKAFDTDGLSEEKFVTIRVVEPAPVNQAPVISVISPENGSVFSIGETINLSAEATDTDDNLEKINFKINDQFYQTSTRNPANGIFTPQEVGTYKIAARAFDTEGLSQEKFVTITVERSLSNPIFQNNNAKIKVYPNPAKHVINVMGTHKNTNYSIIDMTGKTILRDITKSNNMQLDVTNLANGVYFIKLQSKTGIKTTSFIKQ